MLPILFFFGGGVVFKEVVELSPVIDGVCWLGI